MFYGCDAACVIDKNLGCITLFTHICHHRILDFKLAFLYMYAAICQKALLDVMYICPERQKYGAVAIAVTIVLLP